MNVSKRVQLGQRVTALWKTEFWFCNFACIRTSLDFSFFLSLSVWMSVPVSSYIMTHCMSIYFSSSRELFSFSLNIRIYVRLYCDSLFVYMYVSSSVFLSVFSLNASIGFQLYCHWSFVYNVVPWFLFLSMFLSVSVHAYITANIACLCTSLYPCFSLSLCVWMCIPESEYIIIHSWCICTSLDPCFCLSFSVIVYICVRLYCHWL